MDLTMSISDQYLLQSSTKFFDDFDYSNAMQDQIICEEVKNHLLDIADDTTRFQIIAKLKARATELKITSLFNKWIKAIDLASDDDKFSDKMIALQVLNKHELIYNCKLGYYEWTGKIWEERSRERIRSYISEELGSQTSGAKIRSIDCVIESTVVNDEIIFNRNNVLTFQNGTFCIDSMSFRESQKEDYASIIMNYDYNEKADCPKWEWYIDDIMQGDKNKIALIQEMLGYILYPRNKFETAFFLIGEGSNGKGLLIDMIHETFNEKNISNIQINKLNESFQVIGLLNSMANCIGDIDTSVAGTEGVFKEVVTGDRIKACYKGKDYIEFRPRAKWIISLNDFPKSNDMSFGFLRRMCFINFNVTYTLSPDENSNKPEKMKDINLKEKLCKELSGIFNWLLIGYKRLQEQGNFTENNEQIETKDEYERKTNPVYDFIIDFLSKEHQLDFYGRISNDEIYDKYKKWCDVQGIRAVRASQSFHIELKRLLKNKSELGFYPEIWKINGKTQRGYTDKKSFQGVTSVTEV